MKTSSPLVKYFLFFVVALLALSFLFPPKPKIPSSKNPSFAVRSSDKIFFKNMRAYFYHMKPDKAGVFMLRNLKKLEDEPFQFLLLENEVMDEWYIRAYWKDSSMVGLWWMNEQAINIDTLNNEEQWKFAYDFYTALLNNNDLKYNSLDSSIGPVILDEDQRNLYETTLFDYFRIIGLN